MRFRLKGRVLNLGVQVEDRLLFDKGSAPWEAMSYALAAEGQRRALVIAAYLDGDRT